MALSPVKASVSILYLAWLLIFTYVLLAFFLESFLFLTLPTKWSIPFAFTDEQSPTYPRFAKVSMSVGGFAANEQCMQQSMRRKYDPYGGWIYHKFTLADMASEDATTKLSIHTTGSSWWAYLIKGQDPWTSNHDYYASAPMYNKYYYRDIQVFLDTHVPETKHNMEQGSFTVYTRTTSSVLDFLESQKPLDGLSDFKRKSMPGYHDQPKCGKVYMSSGALLYKSPIRIMGEAMVFAVPLLFKLRKEYQSVSVPLIPQTKLSDFQTCVKISESNVSGRPVAQLLDYISCTYCYDMPSRKTIKVGCDEILEKLPADTIVLHLGKSTLSTSGSRLRFIATREFGWRVFPKTVTVVTLLLWLLLVIISYSFYGLLRYSLFPPQYVPITEPESRKDLHKASSRTSSPLVPRRLPDKSNGYDRKAYDDLVSEATESESQTDRMTPRDIINSSIREQTMWQPDPDTPRDLVDYPITAQRRAVTAVVKDESNEEASSSEEDQDVRFDPQSSPQIGASSEHLRQRKSYQAVPD